MTIPRKIRLDLMTPPEVALRAAMAAVEAMPADTRLTNASVKVGEALALVSDYVDEQMRGVSLVYTAQCSQKSYDDQGRCNDRCCPAAHS